MILTELHVTDQLMHCVVKINVDDLQMASVLLFSYTFSTSKVRCGNVIQTHVLEKQIALCYIS